MVVDKFMKLFFVKFILLVVTMFLCVLFGIHYANKGIESTRGFELSVIEDVTDVEVATNQKELDSGEKPEGEQTATEVQLNDIDGTNLFSVAGKKTSYLLTKGTNYLLDKIHLLLKKLLF